MPLTLVVSCPPAGSRTCGIRNRANWRNGCRSFRSCCLSGSAGSTRRWRPTWRTTRNDWRPRLTYTLPWWAFCTRTGRKPTTSSNVPYRCSTRYRFRDCLFIPLSPVQPTAATTVFHLLWCFDLLPLFLLMKDCSKSHDEFSIK